MNPKSICLLFLSGLVIYLASCSKADNNPTVTNPKNPNPNDTIPKDTTHTNPNPTDTNKTNTSLICPVSFKFKNTIVPEMEYYQIMQNGKQKVAEPYYMRYSKNIFQLSIKDDHTFPLKELRFINKDNLTIIYKDSSIVENNAYTIQNNKDLYLKSSGYLGSFNADKTIFNLNFCAFTYSNDANRPMYPRLYTSVCYSPDRDQSMNYLVTVESLLTGDTLAVNFMQMVYEKK